MTGVENDMYISVIKHLMQCVKRKMLGLDVEYHIFPILFGTQESGKSKGIGKLLEPLDGYILELEVTQVLDKTIAGAFETNSVVFLDELSKADKASMEEVKRMITTKYIDARPPYGRQLEKMDQNCMFIAGSNRPVSEVFKDDEMRRFAEIHTVNRSEDTYPTLDAMDMLDVWRSVDEHAQNKYYLEQRSAIKEMQRGLSTPKYINQWADEIGLKPGTSRRSLETLYNSYGLWLRENQATYGPGNKKQGFGKLLKGLCINNELVGHDTWYLVDDSIKVVEPRDATYILSKSKSDQLI